MFGYTEGHSNSSVQSTLTEHVHNVFWCHPRTCREDTNRTESILMWRYLKKLFLGVSIKKNNKYFSSIQCTVPLTLASKIFFRHRRRKAKSDFLYRILVFMYNYVRSSKHFTAVCADFSETQIMYKISSFVTICQYFCLYPVWKSLFRSGAPGSFL